MLNKTGRFGEYARILMRHLGNDSFRHAFD